MIFFVIFLISVFLSSFSQVLLKISASISYESKWKEYWNWKVMLAYGIFLLSSFMTILAYKGVPFSLGSVLEASGYIWVTLFGWWILKEPVNKRKLTGVFVILLGILIATI